MADDEEWDEEEYEDGEFEDDADGDFEDDNEEDPDFADDDFGADDDAFDDDGGGWGDDDVDLHADQEYIPIEKIKADSDDEHFELDKDGNIISPTAGGLKRSKSVDNQCWTCSNCKATNKLSWTLTKFAMKCCICKQDTYTPTVKIFDSEQWDEPSNDFWECTRCTLHNAIGNNICTACQHENEQIGKDSDDEGNGDGLYQKERDSSDPDDDPMMNPMMNPMHRMGGRFPMRGMDQMGMFSNLLGAMTGGGRMGRRKRKTYDTRPFTERKEANLRNLLIIGFIRKCDVPQLPTKFFDFFNFYYITFDRWDWNFLRGNYTTKKQDLLMIKRSKKDKGKWRNMFGLKHIKMNPNKDKFPRKYQWRLRVLDRHQIESIHDKDNDDEDDNDKKEEEDKDKQKEVKKESFELQYMEVIIGVVNTEKLGNQTMQKAFSRYSLGWGVFAGNGKINKSNDWMRAFKPVKHGEIVNVNMEWMTKDQYKALYATTKEMEQIKDEEAYCVALTFTKNDDDKAVIPKGAAVMLPWSVPYKLAVSSAKKRFEIEWISSNWCCDIDEESIKGMNGGGGDDDHKQFEE